MKKHRINKLIFGGTTLVLVFGLLGTCTWAEWVQDGGRLNSTTRGEAPSLAFCGDIPYVAWIEAETTPQLYVGYLDGGWINLGCLSIDHANFSATPSVAFSGIAPYVTWTDAGVIYVKYYNGSNWVQLGGSLNINPVHYAPESDIAIKGTTPFVARCENDGTYYQIYVTYFNGTNWIQLGGSLNNSPTQDARYPKICVIGEYIFVAWLESNGSYEQLNVKYHNGSSWVQVGEALNSEYALSGFEHSMAKLNNTPYLAWRQVGPYGESILVKYFDGVSWKPMGSGVNSGNFVISNPKIVFNGNTCYVAYQENDQATIKHYSEGAWVLDSASIGSAIKGSFGFSANSKIPFIAFESPSLNGTDVFVKHFVASNPLPATPVVTSTAVNTPTMTPSQGPNRIISLNSSFNPRRNEVTSIYWTQPVSGPTTINIYTIHGEKVRTLLEGTYYPANTVNHIDWRGDNENREFLAAGIYIVHIKAEGLDKKIKTAVVR